MEPSSLREHQNHVQAEELRGRRQHFGKTQLLQRSQVSIAHYHIGGRHGSKTLFTLQVEPKREGSCPTIRTSHGYCGIAPYWSAASVRPELAHHPVTSWTIHFIECLVYGDIACGTLLVGRTFLLPVIQVVTAVVSVNGLEGSHSEQRRQSTMCSAEVQLCVKAFDCSCKRRILKTLDSLVA